MTQKKKPLPSKKIMARVNHRETLGFMITQPVQGPDGLFRAIREAINNSLDVHATKIMIKHGEFEGKPALIISDDGAGFNKKAVQSVMSYAVSSKKRDDLDTIGANGTGVKHFLGLGKLDKTNLTIFTYSKDIPHYTRMDVDFEYLVALANKKAKAEDRVSIVSKPENWESDIPRKTGATLILTGFDGRKMKTSAQLIEEMADYITPRAISYVSVLSNGVWCLPSPAKVRGNGFNFEYSTKELGTVSFELFYGGYGDGPVVCGPTNAIIPLTELWSKMAKEQRGRIAKVWKTTSGYIYIQRANYFRQHDGTFSDEFFESKTSEEFVQLLHLVSDELDKLSEQAADEKSSREKRDLLNRVVQAAKQIAQPEFLSVMANAGESPFSSLGDVEADYYLLPRFLNLWPTETQTISLHNHGQKPVDFNGTTWEISGDAAVISKYNNGTAVIIGRKVGRSVIRVKGSFGEHTIRVNVDHVSSVPFIKGPTYVKPGDIYLYELKRHDRDDVVWEIHNSSEHIRIIPDIDSKKNVSIQIDNTCPDCTFSISVSSRHSKKEIAKKNINVLEEGGKKQLPVLRIGKKDYVLSVGNDYPNTVAQIDYAFSDSPLPEIIVNPLHPRIRKMSNFQASEPILAAIANVAMIDQVADGLVKPSEAQILVEQFVTEVKSRVFTQYKEKEIVLN